MSQKKLEFRKFVPFLMLLFSLLTFTSIVPPIKCIYDLCSCVPHIHIYTPHFIIVVNEFIKWLSMHCPSQFTWIPNSSLMKKYLSSGIQLSKTLWTKTLDWMVKSNWHESETLLSSKPAIISRIQAMKSLRSGRERTGHQGQLPTSFLPMSDKHLWPE